MAGVPPAALVHAAVVGLFGVAALLAPPRVVDTPKEPEPVVVDRTVPSVENLDPAACQIVVESEPDTALVLHRVGARGSEARAEAVTNGHGAHRFIDLVPGTYHVTAHFRDDVVAGAPVVDCTGDALRAAVTIARPTEVGLLEGRVVGHGDVAPAGVELMLDQPAGYRGALAGVAHLPVDGEGRYRARVPVGRALLLAAAPHHVAARAELMVRKDAPLVNEMRLAWRPEAHGRVVDASGLPVAGAQISVGPHFDPSAPPRIATTADDGTFTVEVVSGRPFTLTARSARGVKTIALGAVRETAGVHDVELRLAEGRDVMGYVQDARGAPRPFTDVAVRVRDLGILDVVKTDENGRFVARGLPHDDVELWPRDGAIGAWGGAVATAEMRGVLLTFVPTAYTEHTPR